MTVAFWTIAYVAAINTLALATFAWDKYCARTNRWRVPETTLLQLALIGGSVGAKLAQIRLRHKSYKQPFGRRLDRIIVLHAVAIIALPVFVLSPELRGQIFGLLSEMTSP